MVAVSSSSSSSVGAGRGWKVSAPSAPSVQTPSGRMEWKWTLRFSAPPKRWIAVTLPVRPPSIPRRAARRRWKPKTARRKMARIDRVSSWSQAQRQRSQKGRLRTHCRCRTCGKEAGHNCPATSTSMHPAQLRCAASEYLRIRSATRLAGRAPQRRSGNTISPGLLRLGRRGRRRARSCVVPHNWSRRRGLCTRRRRAARWRSRCSGSGRSRGRGRRRSGRRGARRRRSEGRRRRRGPWRALRRGRSRGARGWSGAGRRARARGGGRCAVRWLGSPRGGKITRCAGVAVV